MLDFIKKNKLLLLLLIVGFFLRIYNKEELFMYSHDQDLEGWFIKDVLVEKHLRLIGQETSTQGIFIGPLFYYLLIPFYLLFDMDPIGGVYLVALLGVFSIFSFYFVFKEIIDKKAGIIAATLYTFSFYTIFNDREVVPTMPVILWSVWFLYSIDLILKGKQKLSFVLLAILGGLIWHMNASLSLTIPLVPLALLLSKRKIDFKALVFGFVIFIIILTPLFVFEFKHSFVQSKALKVALTTNQNDIVSGYDKFIRTLDLIGKNIKGLLWGDLLALANKDHLILAIFFIVFLWFKKLINTKWVFLLLFWVFIFIGFFSSYSKILSEYYLNGTMVVWIFVLTVLFSSLTSRKKYRILGIIFILMFVSINIYRFFTIPINRSGYKYRKAVVEEIKADAVKHNYPCVSVSYITSPGNDKGYRYFFFLFDMHVNQPVSGSPVYTIVYPLKPIFRVDKTFGSIGLIYPDYSIYNEEKVKISCSGKNSNLTDPMYGFTN